MLVVQRLQVVGLEGLDEDRRVRVVEIVAPQDAGERRLQLEAEGAEVGGVLGLRIDADPAAQLLRQPRPQVEDLLERGDLEQPVVEGVARVKSWVNQPVVDTPSSSTVRRRSANSGCADTSVVPPISGSCRATSTPSLVDTRSGSTKSAPIRAPSSYEARVCSGR
jgi:hypothetical protein